MSACLDSWAVLAWLDDEGAAAERVDAIMDSRPVMSWINVVEVYYLIEQSHSRFAADETLATLRGVVELDLPGQTRMLDAAHLKAARAIALGDCFAIATAAALGVPLLTGDPEILGQVDLPCAVEDLRPHPT